MNYPKTFYKNGEWNGVSEADAVVVANAAAEAEAREAGYLPIWPTDPDTGRPAGVSPRETETKVYADGTSATGLAPLPDRSPAEQEADEAGGDEPASPAKIDRRRKEHRGT